MGAETTAGTTTTRPAPVALVTGAARRLGREMALALAADGFDVLVHFHTSRDEAAAVVAAVGDLGRRAQAVPADLRRSDEVQWLFETLDATFGRLDLLVNSASVFQETPFETLDEDAWALHLDVNLTAAFRCARAAVPRLRTTQATAPDPCGRTGLIVNLVDASGLRPWRNFLAHSVSKAGLVALTAGLARELAPRLRVNAICPGVVLWPAHSGPAERARALARVPLGRAGTPADVVRALRYLVHADYVTGEVLRVDGGRLLA